MTSYLRPDEEASKTQIRQSHKFDKSIKNFGSGAMHLAGAIVGGGIAARIMPFLSEFISPEMALKGISKVSPKLGDVLHRGIEKGLSLKEGLSYLKKEIEGKGQYGKGEEMPEVPSQPSSPQKMAGGVPYEGSIRQLIQEGGALKAPEYRETSNVPMEAGERAGEEKLIKAMQNLQNILQRGKR